jgi:hypothetical protein
MPRDKYEVESSLQKKGFRISERDHHFFIYYTQEGKKTEIRTKTSHTKKKKVIDDYLLNQMAHQCQLTNHEFNDFIDCPMKQNQYEMILKMKQIL